ncbi:MAG: outer membrane protein assembly factor BamA [Rikenellaceae bacterium]
MRILLLAALAVLSTSYKVFAQSDVDSLRTDNLQTVDYQKSNQYVIKDVKVYGIENFDSEVIIYNSGLNRGDTLNLPGNYISDAIKKIWNQGYFSDVKVVIDELGADSINLELHLTERPRVSRWAFEGPSKSETTTLIEDIKLINGSELSDYLLTTTVDKIKTFYIEKGFRNVEVDIVQINDPVIPNSVRVTFLIDKKEKVKIETITFSGNNEVSSRSLENSMKGTKDKHIFNIFKSSKLNNEDYETDKLLVIDNFNSKGFRNATILSDSIYSINDKRIGIHINVEEGDKFYYRDIEWIGNSKYDTEMLNRMVGVSTGDVYDRKTLMKRLGIGMDSNPDEMSVSTLYQNDGHLFFQVEPAETVVGKDSIDIMFKVLEGKQALINEVTISGNQRVNDEVIRRDLYIRPGDLYNRSLLMSTLRQLSQMSHFNPETLSPDIQPISDELVNIGFPLEEQASDKLEVSGGWGSNMFVGSVGVQLNNISIKNFLKKDQWRPYPAGQNQQLSITGQSNGTYYKAISLGFTEPWLGGKKPNSLSVSAYFSEESNAYYFYDSATAYFRTTGVSVGLGRRLKWPDQYFTLYNEFTYKAYSLDDWSYFIMENGRSNVFAFKTAIERNSIDQPIYPRRGSSFSAAVTVTPPYSLFDGKDYSDEDMSDEEKYKWIEYHKWEFAAEWYQSLSSNQNLVLMIKAQFGGLGSYNSDKLSPFECFDVGGDGMSGYSVYGVDVIGLRGYEDSGLNPYSSTGDYSRVYNKYTMELRYPIILQPSSTIYGLVFAEGGNGFSSLKEFNPLTIKRSVGAGIRMYLPIVGLIGIDWAYGLDNAATSSVRSGGQFHFTMGTTF